MTVVCCTESDVENFDDSLPYDDAQANRANEHQGNVVPGPVAHCFISVPQLFEGH
jgi:hypothetical protein